MSPRFPLLQRILLLFILGAAGGTLGDLCHVLSGIESYPSRWPLLPGTPLPYWIPIEFGFAAASLGFSHEIFPLKMKSPRGSRFQIDILGSIFVFHIAWALSGFLPFETGGGKDIALGLTTLLTWYFFDRRKLAWISAFATAFVGTWIEATLVRRGYFSYRADASNLWGVPSWLPWIYMLASIATGNLSAWMRRHDSTD